MQNLNLDHYLDNSNDRITAALVMRTTTQQLQPRRIDNGHSHNKDGHNDDEATMMMAIVVAMVIGESVTNGCSDETSSDNSLGDGDSSGSYGGGRSTLYYTCLDTCGHTITVEYHGVNL